MLFVSEIVQNICHCWTLCCLVFDTPQHQTVHAPPFPSYGCHHCDTTLRVRLFAVDHFAQEDAITEGVHLHCLFGGGRGTHWTREGFRGRVDDGTLCHSVGKFRDVGRSKVTDFGDKPVSTLQGGT